MSVDKEKWLRPSMVSRVLPDDRAHTMVGLFAGVQSAFLLPRIAPSSDSFVQVQSSPRYSPSNSTVDIYGTASSLEERRHSWEKMPGDRNQHMRSAPQRTERRNARYDKEEFHEVNGSRVLLHYPTPAVVGTSNDSSHHHYDHDRILRLPTLSRDDASGLELIRHFTFTHRNSATVGFCPVSRQ
ncbi:hypothetical protein KIN20_014206 [Parelaphostrongylus tenuis]|uniref:Uncharacterized protein n=1 Tax=Parelaphostrongylus tenuis TaxID=148309 RepID=A0AAD5MD97_PARTN|nr:hypothetical protein KIN20_014206 [Parelaphostrongylus tenuis]